MSFSESLTLAALIVTAIATTVLAVATWRLVKGTNRLVGENKQLVTENNRLVAAAEAEAKASLATVEEIRRDRELAYRPYLTFEITIATPDIDVTPGTPPPAPSRANTDTVHFVNYGRGPALSAIVCEALTSSWRRTKVFDLSADDEGDLDVTQHPLAQNPGGGLLGSQYPGQGLLAGRWAAAFCEDLFGNRYRFQPRLADADVWRPGEPEPGWAIWYALQKKLD